MNDDATLLRRYAEDKSEAAFTEFVHRRLDLVYAVARRKVGGDAHLAEDVVQRVFSDVAKKAATLAGHPVLTGWLFTSTHYAAIQVVRTERRRRTREEKAEIMNKLRPGDDAAPEVDWDQLRPLLDDLVNELGDRDRAAVLWRFFDGLPLAEIGRRLRLTEAGAQSRVDRAVAKLRAALCRRGVTSTAAALSVALANQAGAAAPAGLASSVAATALAGAAGVATTSGLMAFMTATKTAFAGSALLSVAGLILLTSVSIAVFEVEAARDAQTDWSQAQARFQANNAALPRLESRARQAKSEVAAAKARLAGLQSAATAGKPGGQRGTTSTAAPRDPRADGKAFLATLNDQEKQALNETIAAQFRTGFALMIREAGLSPAQLSAYESRLVQHWMEHLTATPSDIGIDPDDDELSDDEERAILGEDTFPWWQLAGRKNPANEWVSGLALRINGDPSAEPLTPERMGELANIVASHSPEFQAGDTVDPKTVDWNAVASDAQRLLSAAQWRQAQSWLLKQEVALEIAALKQTAKSP